MALLAEKKNSELFSEPSMHFWGITCKADKQYEQVVGSRFRITMAVLDPKSMPKAGSDKTVSLLVKRSGSEYLLCILKHGEIHQVNLNLIFDKGENVVFFTEGHGDVCLSGYQLTDSERDAQNDETRYLCPLVEVGPSKNQSLKSPLNVEPESITPKSKKKSKKEKVQEDFVTSEDRKTLKHWNSMSNKNGIQVLQFDDTSDESDEDFSIAEESSESEESEEDDEESEEELKEEIIDLKNDAEEEEEDEDKIEPEPEGSSGSRKRKLEKISENQENSFNDNDSSDSDVVALPSDDTPISKKTMKMENSSENKMSKKTKKKLNESNSFEESITEKSPKRSKITPTKSPVKKLEGGIEIQDVIIGKGPIATKGKMVHVFYVGRFHNKRIFDSRLPGKRPFSFKLGASQVIKGWDVGLLGMKVGGKRKLKVPPHMGYGSSRMEGIPPNSTLFFLVELQAVS